MTNPFANKLPLDINSLPSRQEIISRIGHNMSSGISSLIISEPKMGTHSLIAHLISVQTSITAQG